MSGLDPRMIPWGSWCRVRYNDFNNEPRACQFWGWCPGQNVAMVTFENKDHYDLVGLDHAVLLELSLHPHHLAQTLAHVVESMAEIRKSLAETRELVASSRQAMDQAFKEFDRG